MNRKLTDHQVHAICVEREAGATLETIAKRYGVTASAIRWRCLANGAERPGLKTRPTPFGAPSHVRGGIKVNIFTAEEDALIRALALQDYRPFQIAAVLTKRWPDRPRKPHTITARLATLARWEEVEANR